MSIICGDCLDVMKTFPNNHFSSIVTDPPYGLSFMGKGWDHEVPGMEFWRECLRITKPGSFLIAFGGTRTFHHLAYAIEKAGFEIRDCISWIYGSGFPKSHNHFGIKGYGTALKPAQELCSLAMKPLDGTFKQNAEKWGQAGINIDGCRIGTDTITTNAKLKGSSFTHLGNGEGFNGCPESTHKGRWPANVLFDEEAAAQLGEPARFFYCAKTSSRERNEGLDCFDIKSNMRVNGPRKTEDEKTATKVKNFHPTVKPLALMRYLITLVSPPTNALILDPFAGSGSTILAAKQLGIEAIGIEKQADYCEIARNRIKS